MPDSTYPGPETIGRHILDSGITVLTYENNAAASFVLEGLVRAGALAESREQAGLASYTAEMLMRGASLRSFDQIYEALEAVGASLNIDGRRHVTDFSARGLAEDLDLILELLADSLRNPTFAADQIEPVRGEFMTNLQIRANDTRHMAALTFREMLYQDHPYGQSVDGYQDSIAAINREDLMAFHEAYYGPRGMILTVVGAIPPAEIVAKVEEAFGDWSPEQQELPVVPPASRPESVKRAHHNMPQKSQSDIVIGLPGPLRSAPDYLEASMANTILGVFGMSGRLGQNVREKQGLAYYAFSRLQGGLGPSPWYASTGVSPNKVDQAIRSILQEIERIRTEPIAEDELTDCQAFRTGSLPVSLETNGGMASVFTDMELYDLGLDYLQQLTDKLMAMTPESVQAAAQKYLDAEQVAIAVAGPELIE